MTMGPRRLKDDAEFKWETGCDLAFEAGSLPPVDHERARNRLVAMIAALPTGAGAEGLVGDGIPKVAGKTAAKAGTGKALWMAAVLSGAVVVGGSFWLGTRVPQETAVERPSAAPAAVPDVHKPIPVPPDRSTDGSADAVALESALSRGAPVPTTSLPRTGEMAPMPVPTATPMGTAVPPAQMGQPEPSDSALGREPLDPASGTGEAPEAARAVSPLAADLAAFRPAADALAGERMSEARVGFEHYLATQPSGTLRNEAQLGLLQALFVLGEVTQTASLAEKIQDIPSLSSKRNEILRLRAESLVRLGRCDEALLVADALPGRSQDLKRICRGSGGE